MDNNSIIEELKKEDITSIRWYIWKDISEFAKDKWLTQEQIWESIWKSHAYVNQILKWKTGSAEKYIEVCQKIWVPNSKIITFFKNALEKRKDKIFWSITTELNTLEDIDFDIALSRQYGVTDEQAIADIKKYIDFIKNK
jgi:hypothetical protein